MSEISLLSVTLVKQSNHLYTVCVLFYRGIYLLTAETDTRLVAAVVVDGYELFTEIGERLNKDIRAVKNWRNLAYRLNIPHEVYDAFDTSKAAAKSSTKMLFEWLAQWKPNLNVSDLLKGLKEIDRFDVVDLVTKETSLGEFIFETTRTRTVTDSV